MPSPVYRAMRAGSIVRVEELTRMPSDVQDALVTVLSEKTMPVPELGSEVLAARGLQSDRHRQRPRPGHQRTVGRVAPALQHGRAAAARIRPTRRSRSSPGGSTSSAPRCGCRRFRRRRRDPPRRHRVPRVALGRHRRRPHSLKVPERHAVDRRGDLGGHQRSVAGRPLRRRRAVGGRRRRRRRRRRRPGPRPRRRRLARVPRGRRRQPRRLVRLLRSLPSTE